MDIDYILEKLGMSVEDADLIKERCNDKGISTKQLIQQFLFDFINNDSSGGSDERMMISSWFRRSQF